MQFRLGFRPAQQIRALLALAVDVLVEGGLRVLGGASRERREYCDLDQLPLAGSPFGRDVRAGGGDICRLAGGIAGGLSEAGLDVLHNAIVTPDAYEELPWVLTADMTFRPLAWHGN